MIWGILMLFVFFCSIFVIMSEIAGIKIAIMVFIITALVLLYIWIAAQLMSGGF